jgi:hypothetical protein
LKPLNAEEAMTMIIRKGDIVEYRGPYGQRFLGTVEAIQLKNGRVLVWPDRVPVPSVPVEMKDIISFQPEHSVRRG